MCTVCGCGSGETRIGALGGGRRAGHDRPAQGPTRTWRALDTAATVDAKHADRQHTLSIQAESAVTDGTHIHHGHHHLHFGTGPAHAHAPGLSQAQMVKIERDILGKNDARADQNRAWLRAHGIFALNLVSSPGSGKTSLLVSTLEALAGRIPSAVIEGDQQTEFDAERIRATGVPALQINTGKGCHLDADMVARALPRMRLADGSLLLIENVGNLVCPAAFDLGEAHKVAILSVTEGEDKPMKYPDMFAAASVMLLNKVDLLPYLRFDAQRAIDYALRVNPALRVIRTSATTGEGLDEWLAWIEAGIADARATAAQA
ncbi:hydrogenase nickel incorporation protein HypB [Thauera sp. WB-2]|uniref:hydrogenase nickel incorporation protein HypB n=1 Tax=Thauera sp. WB-2 TaxID=2897772 RepID=UPI0022DD1DA4|nr:hydrogenase nickel incorporation protein HypB [Thauera sp. WB-2]WBL64640.1 hydrogenase nickel incorporation protein HypB [Thauera sp. WB-2]